jgi:N-acetylmuramoyl-L-alanine amidase
MSKELKIDTDNHLLQAKEGEIKIMNPLSPNKGSKFEDKLPDTIILHYTAGPSVESAVNTLCNPSVKASAHLVIDLDGSITQLVPFDTIAWHAGKSSHGGRSGFNKYSIGIEIVNAGKLKPQDGKYAAWWGELYEKKDVLEAVHQNHSSPAFWHTYTQEQIDCVLNICITLKEVYSITNILGHDEIAPSRKVDPGPAFPTENIRSRVFGRDEDIEDDPSADEPATEGVVLASKLNIRHGPNSSADLAGPPLTGGTKVKIIGKKNGWYEVEIARRGWVSKDFLAT